MPDNKQPAQTPLPRSVEVLLEESRKLREAADRLKGQAKDLKRAIQKDRARRK